MISHKIWEAENFLNFHTVKNGAKEKKSFGILNAERNLKSKVTMLQNYEVVILTLISIFALKNPWNQKQNNWFSKFLAYFFQLSIVKFTLVLETDILFHSLKQQNRSHFSRILCVWILQSSAITCRMVWPKSIQMATILKLKLRLFLVHNYKLHILWFQKRAQTRKKLKILKYLKSIKVDCFENVNFVFN